MREEKPGPVQRGSDGGGPFPPVLLLVVGCGGDGRVETLANLDESEAELRRQLVRMPLQVREAGAQQVLWQALSRPLDANFELKRWGGLPLVAWSTRSTRPACSGAERTWNDNLGRLRGAACSSVARKCTSRVTRRSRRRRAWGVGGYSRLWVCINSPVCDLVRGKGTLCLGLRRERWAPTSSPLPPTFRSAGYPVDPFLLASRALPRLSVNWQKHLFPLWVPWEGLCPLLATAVRGCRDPFRTPGYFELYPSLTLSCPVSLCLFRRV